jgi:hypothetical protein
MLCEQIFLVPTTLAHVLAGGTDFCGHPVFPISAWDDPAGSSASINVDFVIINVDFVIIGPLKTRSGASDGAFPSRAWERECGAWE